MTDTRSLTLTLYAIAFMTAISLFGLVDAVSAGRDATAAISVTRPGTAASMPARAEIDALLACG